MNVIRVRELRQLSRVVHLYVFTDVTSGCGGHIHLSLIVVMCVWCWGFK